MKTKIRKTKQQSEENVKLLPFAPFVDMNRAFVDTYFRFLIAGIDVMSNYLLKLNRNLMLIHLEMKR